MNLLFDFGLQKLAELFDTFMVAEQILPQPSGTCMAINSLKVESLIIFWLWEGDFRGSHTAIDNL